MIFGRLTPWETPRQRHLLRACFHVDAARAKALAIRWLARYALDDATYPEHRLLVRLLSRFPDLALEPSTASRLAGLKRQLWVRGNMNLKSVRPALGALDDFGVSWVLTGAAQWFVQPQSLANEAADYIEIIVPEPARSTALHLLAQSGWRAQYTAPDAHAGPVFTRFSKGQSALRLSKAAPLFHYAPALQDSLWENRIAHRHETGTFFLPDAAATLAMALGKAHPKYGRDDQWVFDLFNQSPDPKILADGQGLPRRIARRISRALHGNFYR